MRLEGLGSETVLAVYNVLLDGEAKNHPDGMRHTSLLVRRGSWRVVVSTLPG